MWKGWDIMKICGLQKTTLLDFPGHVAATIFTGGCNFRCPFCHNSDLLGSDAPAAFTDLEDFIQKVRALEYQIKLDTNGYRPEVLKRLCEKGLVDYVAMDIKACEERYPAVAGVSSLQMENIRESIEFLKSGAVPYEFRTTVVRELHSAEDFQKIGPWIAGAPLYFLQNFSDSGSVLNPIYTSCTVPELTSYLEIVKPFVGHAELRGIDY